MKDLIYPYDQQLYGRSFLDCYQRQSLVMLAERGLPVSRLFSRCLISTDAIVEQVIRGQRPKYDFQSRFFDAADLRRIGVDKVDLPIDTFTEAKPLLLQRLATEGFACLVIDVFYLAHCPEYRNQHLVHTITVIGHSADTGDWQIMDDNPASVLCTYSYPDSVLAAALENNTLRRVRYFPRSTENDLSDAPDTILAETLAGHADSFTLFTRIEDIAGDPWITPDRAITLLHDAFLIYLGSRTCLLDYVTRLRPDPDAEQALRQLTATATEVTNHLLIGKVTGFLDVTAVSALGAQLVDGEQRLIAALQAAEPRFAELPPTERHGSKIAGS